jgi:hypothetical protein
VAVAQINKTKRAAEASRDAISLTLAHTRSAFNQYALSSGDHFLSEAKIFFDAKNWPMAALRLGDLAVQAAQLAQTAPTTDVAGWNSLATHFRKWEGTCRRLDAQELEIGPNLTVKWHKFTGEASAQLDNHHGPFASMSNSNG